MGAASKCFGQRPARAPDTTLDEMRLLLPFYIASYGVGPHVRARIWLAKMGLRSTSSPSRKSRQ